MLQRNNYPNTPISAPAGTQNPHLRTMSAKPWPHGIYGIFTASCAISSLFLHTNLQTPGIHLTKELPMDIVYLSTTAGFWAVLVLLVWGFNKLENPKGGQS